MSLSLWDFDGMPQIGQLVVNVDVVPDIEIIFGRLFAARFPIRQMRVIDDFGADDFASIEADNTSSFNCRLRTGSSDEWSQHSYGRAIDVNPIENPYISTDGRVAHRASRPFLDRADVRPGMAVEGSALVAAFEAQGWGWGGRWAGPIDLQHFSKDGR